MLGMMPFILARHYESLITAQKSKSNYKVTNLFRCAIEELLQLLFTASFMAGIKDVDLGLCP